MVAGASVPLAAIADGVIFRGGGGGGFNRAARTSPVDAGADRLAAPFLSPSPPLATICTGATAGASTEKPPEAGAAATGAGVDLPGSGADPSVVFADESFGGGGMLAGTRTGTAASSTDVAIGNVGGSCEAPARLGSLIDSGIGSMRSGAASTRSGTTGSSGITSLCAPAPKGEELGPDRTAGPLSTGCSASMLGITSSPGSVAGTRRPSK